MKGQLALLLLFCFVGCSAAASDLTGIVGFSPTDTRTQKFGLTFGLGYKEWLFSISSIFNSEYSEDDFVDAPIPHSSYESLGTKRIDNMYGLDVGYAWDLWEGLPMVTTGVGFYSGRESQIGRSTATGWLWAQDKNSKTFGAASFGLLMRPADTAKFKIGAEYHTMRGLSLYAQIDF